jgi:hypothetical protein
MSLYNEKIEYKPAALVATDVIPSLKLFHGDFDDGADVISQFEIPKEEREGITIHWAEYNYESYSGSAFVLWEKDGKLYSCHASHCSCFGLEGQWEADPTSAEDLFALHEGYKARGATYSVADDPGNERMLLQVMEFLRARGL